MFFLSQKINNLYKNIFKCQLLSDQGMNNEWDDSGLDFFFFQKLSIFSGLILAVLLIEGLRIYQLIPN